jgi:hypothetical protein
MRKKTTKTKRDFTQVTSQVLPARESVTLENFEGFGVGDWAWYRVSLSMPSYSCGLIKEIRRGDDGVTFFIWDGDRGMWRCLRREDIYNQRPPRKKRGE